MAYTGRRASISRMTSYSRGGGCIRRTGWMTGWRPRVSDMLDDEQLITPYKMGDFSLKRQCWVQTDVPYLTKFVRYFTSNRPKIQMPMLE